MSKWGTGHRPSKQRRTDINREFVTQYLNGVLEPTLLERLAEHANCHTYWSELPQKLPELLAAHSQPKTNPQPTYLQYMIDPQSIYDQPTINAPPIHHQPAATNVPPITPTTSKSEPEPAMASETTSKPKDMDPIKFLILCITTTKDGSKLNVDFDKVAEIMGLKSGTAAYWRYKRLIDKETKGAAAKDANADAGTSKGAATKDAATPKGKGRAGKNKRAAGEQDEESVAKKVKTEVEEDV